MFTSSLFHHRQLTCARVIVLCALPLIAALALTKAGATRPIRNLRSGHKAAIRNLTFEDRVAAQRAIEAVYHRRRLWPTDSPQPKPALDVVLPEAALRAKVEDYLRMSRALEVFAGAPLAPAALQQELERMARQTRSPGQLGELWAALARDPLLAAECLARPVVVERELRKWIADCGLRNADCGALRQSAFANPQSASGASAPSARSEHTAVWTGSEMIIWGGYNDSSYLNTGGRYSFAPPLTISPTTQSFTATGGTGSVTIAAPGGCAWTATSNAGFITITSVGSGAGNGAVNFGVAPNTGQNARMGTLTICSCWGQPPSRSSTPRRGEEFPTTLCHSPSPAICRASRRPASARRRSRPKRLSRPSAPGWRRRRS
jgi:hypothetical protein